MSSRRDTHLGTLVKHTGRSRVAMLDTTGCRVVDFWEARPGAIQLWTDGSCYPNPGPSSCGVVYIDGSYRLELSEFLGHGSNNTAELTAVLHALALVPNEDAPVDVYCDSEYVIGSVALDWGATKNRELIMECRATYNRLRDVRFVKVKGHASVEGNETADWLAGIGREAQASQTWRSDDVDATVCQVCRMPQFNTRSGRVCRNAHGGADGILLNEP